MNTPDAVTELADARTLPRLAPGQRLALNRLYGEAPALVFDAAPLAGRLYFAPPPRELAGSIEPWCRFRLQLGQHAGVLAIDAAGVARLLGETRPELLPGTLRTVLLAEALHALVDTLKSATRLRFDWLPSDDGADSPALVSLDGALGFELRDARDAPALCGFVHLDDAAAWDTLLPTLATRPRRAAGGTARFDSLRLPLHFEIGSTLIALKELAGIRAGDVIGIERWAARGSVLQVSANAGGRAGWHLVGIAEGSHITLTAIGEPRMNRDDPAAAEPAVAADPASLPLSRLDALEVVLRFEVGELSLTLGELKNLSPGHVFDLGQALNRCDVRILAHGNLLGRGYLVAVGDRLGVRVSEFAPNEL